MHNYKNKNDKKLLTFYKKKLVMFCFFCSFCIYENSKSLIEKVYVF